MAAAPNPCDRTKVCWDGSTVSVCDYCPPQTKSPSVANLSTSNRTWSVTGIDAYNVTRTINVFANSSNEASMNAQRQSGGIFRVTKVVEFNSCASNVGITSSSGTRSIPDRNH